MKRILIFSGTTEGRELAEFLRNRQVDVIVSVATEYGRDCMDVESSSNVSVRTGRMDETQIQQFLTAQKIDLVVDATHPFAAEVTKNVEQACRMAGTEYIRCVRERQNWDDKGERVVRVESVPEAVEYLQNTDGNVLIATGSKELKEDSRLQRAMLCPCPFYTGFSGREHSAWIRRKASDRHAGSVFKRIKSCDAKSCGCQIFCDKRIRKIRWFSGEGAGCRRGKGCAGGSRKTV